MKLPQFCFVFLRFWFEILGQPSILEEIVRVCFVVDFFFHVAFLLKTLKTLNSK